jgi:hypothetical protein
MDENVNPFYSIYVIHGMDFLSVDGIGKDKDRDEVHL